MAKAIFNFPHFTDFLNLVWEKEFSLQSTKTRRRHTTCGFIKLGLDGRAIGIFASLGSIKWRRFQLMLWVNKKINFQTSSAPGRLPINLCIQWVSPRENNAHPGGLWSRLVNAGNNTIQHSYQWLKLDNLSPLKSTNFL